MAGGGDPERVRAGRARRQRRRPARPAGLRRPRAGRAAPRRPGARRPRRPARGPLPGRARHRARRRPGSGPGPAARWCACSRTCAADGDPARLRALLRAGGPVRARLLAVLGTSAALGDHLARHPPRGGHWTHGGPEGPADAAPERRCSSPSGPTREAGEPVAGLPGPAALDALRVAYRYRLLAVAGVRPRCSRPRRRRARRLPGARRPRRRRARGRPRDRPRASCRAAPNRAAWRSSRMGKCGGQELNYVSDVDVVYVAEPVDGRRRGRAGRARDRREAGRRPDPGLLRGHRRGDAVAGGRRPAPGGQARAAGADPREPRGVLPALGEDLGVPGPAQGPPGRGRRPAGRGVRRRDPADGVAGGRARALRRGRAGDAAPRRGARARRTRPAAS